MELFFRKIHEIVTIPLKRFFYAYMVLKFEVKSPIITSNGFQKHWYYLSWSSFNEIFTNSKYASWRLRYTELWSWCLRMIFLPQPQTINFSSLKSEPLFPKRFWILKNKQFKNLPFIKWVYKALNFWSLSRSAFKNEIYLPKINNVFWRLR